MRDDQHRHLVRVLRLRDGAPVVATDGEGRLVDAVLAGDELAVTGGPMMAPAPAPGVAVLQVVPAGRKLDQVTCMLAEVGIRALQPVTSHHASPFARDVDGARRRLERLRAIAASALEQSRSARLMQVRAAVELGAGLSGEADCQLLLDPEGRSRVGDVDVAGASLVALAVGPQSGWSHDERSRGGNRGGRRSGLVSRSCAPSTPRWQPLPSSWPVLAAGAPIVHGDRTDFGANRANSGVSCDNPRIRQGHCVVFGCGRGGDAT